MNLRFYIIATVVLTLVLGFGVFKLVSGGQSTNADSELALAVRVEQFIDLRKHEDWAHLYELVDPAERKTMSLARFISYFGQGVSKLNTIEPRAVTVNHKKQVAAVGLYIDMELLPDRLPAAFRRNLQPSDKDQLRQQTEQSLQWVRRDKVWYFQCGRELAMGRDTKGNPIRDLRTAR